MPEEIATQQTETESEVKWLEDRLDAQDLRQTKIETMLSNLLDKLEESPESFTKQTKAQLLKLETQIAEMKEAQTLQGSSRQSPESQSTQPKSEPVQPNESNVSQEDQTKPKPQRSIRRAI